MEIVGAGSTKITAYQQGNYLYESALPVSRDITVIKAEQTITFTELPDRSVGDFPFELTATSTSDLPVKFVLSDLSLASLKDNFVTVRNAGTLTVTAYQEGNEKFFPAEEVTESFSIRFGNLFSDSVPGMELWLDSTDINNDGKTDNENDFISLDRISLWADKSGKNNSPVEADISRMPIWKPDFINAKPAVEFSGTDGHYLSLQNSISDPTYLFAVAKQNQTGQSQIFRGNLFTTNEYGFTLNYDSQSDLISSSIPGNSWSVCVFETRFESQNLWINGELMGSASINIHPSPLDKIGHLFSGHIAECIVFTEGINFVNRQKIESYLGHKWGLTDRFPELHPYTLEPAAFGGDQEIIWLGIEDGGEGQPASLPVWAKSDQDFTLSALASSGLPVIFQVVTLQSWPLQITRPKSSTREP